ncbi:MAG: hypothetical protein IJG55_04270, partial [Synergistaceae bacterium]|nr:hypothetical protein [Synergistaceae bacterium]
DMVKNYRGLWAKFEEDVKAQVGDKVTYVTDVDKPAFQKAVQPLYDGLKKSDPATYSFVERIQKAQ